MQVLAESESLSFNPGEVVGGCQFVPTLSFILLVLHACKLLIKDGKGFA